jgi:hypothetical protein
MGRLRRRRATKSRELLNPLVRDADPATVLSNKRFPWLSYRPVELGMCPVRAVRVAYTGELGWELHHPIEMQNYLFDQLMAAGEGVGLRLVGARAQNWLRQEKSYRAFGTELGRDATPLEADLPRFVDMTKDFHGKAAMEETGIRAKCVTLLIDGPPDADPWGREALYAGAEKVGRLTSGGWSVAFGADRHGLRQPRTRHGRHQAETPHAARAVGRRGGGGQPLRPEERTHPRGRLIGSGGGRRRRRITRGRVQVTTGTSSVIRKFGLCATEMLPPHFASISAPMSLEPKPEPFAGASRARQRIVPDKTEQTPACRGVGDRSS